MSADVLRAAAEKLRQLGDAASRGPWTSYIEGRDHLGGDSMISTSEPPVEQGVIGPDSVGDIYARVSVDGGYHKLWRQDQDYIASMHPFVAFHLADLFEAEAKAWVEETTGTSNGAWVDRRFRHVTNVARAYLGLDTPTPSGRVNGGKRSAS